ncbi:MAG: FtsX-like permease family protein [Acidimicrobiia bacterium]|nr:FtsX-like permease family protein [Acidimicrobiia bacterium]
MNDRLADTLGVRAGDPVELYLAGRPVRLEVAAVVARTGLAGFAQAVVSPEVITAHGTEAQSFLDRASEETDEQEGFLTLLRGFLGLGLVIGIAGLGVVLVRAVRERRREIGMLRAVGVAAPTIRRAFLVEAVFIGAQGVLIGTGLGLLSSGQLLTKSATFEENLRFVVPWFSLPMVALVALGASVAAALVPAARAGRIPPAAASRIAG